MTAPDGARGEWVCARRQPEGFFFFGYEKAIERANKIQLVLVFLVFVFSLGQRPKNTVWQGLAVSRWESYMRLMTHYTKKNLLVNVQKGCSFVGEVSSQGGMGLSCYHVS